MNVRNTLKFIGDASAAFIALTIALGIVGVISATAMILLALLGKWLGINEYIFVYLAAFCITYKAFDVIGWIVDKMADRIERKKEREYFERINRKP